MNLIYGHLLRYHLLSTLLSIDLFQYARNVGLKRVAFSHDNNINVIYDSYEIRDRHQIFHLTLCEHEAS